MQAFLIIVNGSQLVMKLESFSLFPQCPISICIFLFQRRNYSSQFFSFCIKPYFLSLSERKTVTHFPLPSPRDDLNSRICLLSSVTFARFKTDNLYQYKDQVLLVYKGCPEIDKTVVSPEGKSLSNSRWN